MARAGLQTLAPQLLCLARPILRGRVLGRRPSEELKWKQKSCVWAARICTSGFPVTPRVAGVCLWLGAQRSLCSVLGVGAGCGLYGDHRWGALDDANPVDRLGGQGIFPESHESRALS